MYNEISYGTSAAPSGDLIIGAFGWLLIIGAFIFTSFLMYRIAAYRMGHADIAWWAFVPILNTILLIKMADKEMWWVILLFIPIVNWITFIILWMKVAESCGQSQVWGFLATLPLLNFVALFVLAYGGGGSYKEESPEKKYPVSIS